MGELPIWFNVGAHHGEELYPHALAGEALIYAFEPNVAVCSREWAKCPNYIVVPMAVTEDGRFARYYINNFSESSSLLPFNEDGLAEWLKDKNTGLGIIGEALVPSVRLDTFMDMLGIGRVEYMLIDTEGMDLAVLRSAGERLRDIREIKLEVIVSCSIFRPDPRPLRQGEHRKEETLIYMQQHRFKLIETAPQYTNRVHNLTFVNQEWS